jgi:hypothetical protein
MELWLIFLLAGVLSIAIGLPQSQHNKKGNIGSDNFQRKAIQQRPSGGFLPRLEDDRSALRPLPRLRRWQLAAYYVNVLRYRFLISMETRLEHLGTRFLSSRLEQLKLATQYQAQMDELEAMQPTQGNRLLELQLRQRQMKRDYQRTLSLHGLQLEKERLALEVEIAELRARKDGIQSRQPETKLSPEQQRRLKRLEIEERLEDLDRSEEAAVKKARNEEDAKRLENMYGRQREELRDELSRYLV